MSYAECVDGVIATMQTLPGVRNVLDHEPNSIQESPTILVLADGFRQSIAGGIIATDWGILVRLVIKWVDNPEAERQLKPFMTSIPLAITTDPYLGGWLAGPTAHGMSRVDPTQKAVAGYVKYGGVVLRSLDVFVLVLEKVDAPPISP